MYTFPEPNVYTALELVMKYFPGKFTEQAKAEVETLLDHCLTNIEDNSAKFLTTLFIKAIKKHIGPVNVDEHIYLKKFSLPQITLFDIIIKQFPFVKNSHEVTNNVLYKAMRTQKHAVLMDIGIGRGIQTLHLLDMFDKGDSIETLKIIGIEPFEEAIQLTEAAILERAKTLHFNIEFIAINDLIENVDFKATQRLISPEDKLFVNSSLTLHHIQNKRDRERILFDVRCLDPENLLLTEPNVDHYQENFLLRFQSSYQHFFHVFKVIDNLDVDSNSKSSLKLFFGREIEDIIGKRENDRYEKHDLADNWCEMLLKAGFKLDTEYTPNYTALGSGVEIEQNKEGFLGFRYEDETVLAVMNATC